MTERLAALDRDCVPVQPGAAPRVATMPGGSTRCCIADEIAEFTNEAYVRHASFLRLVTP